MYKEKTYRKSKPNLENQGSISYWPKRAPKTSLPLFHSFWSALHQNKALYNFHESGQSPIARHVDVLD